MISLNYSDIPAYLHDSYFYQCLDSEDGSSVIELPELCYKATDSVEDVIELTHMLHVAKFWGLNNLSLGPVKFCFENLAEAWPVVSAFENAHPDFATLFDGGVNKTLTSAIKTNKKDEIVHYLVKVSECHLYGHDAMFAAAAVGRLDFIEMMHKLGRVWNSDASLAAARAGHLDCLKYLRENGTGSHYDSESANAAAANGHVECLRYLHTYEFLNYSFPKTMACTALGGHLECLKFMCELNYRHDWSVTANAAMGGHLDCLKFLRSVGCEWNHLTILRAAEKGHLPCLQYAVEHGCPREKTAMDLAIKNGHKECVRYLHSQDFVPSPSNIVDASGRGDIEGIKLLRSVGCPWPEFYGLTEAIRLGHLACLQFLVESGCKDGCSDMNLFEQAAQAGRVDTMQYLLSVGRVLDGNIAFSCVKFGHVSCLQFVLEATGLALTWQLSSSAIQFGQLDCLKFLRERGVPWDAQTIGRAIHPDHSYIYDNLHFKAGERVDCLLYAFADGCPPSQWKGVDDMYTALMEQPGFTVAHLMRLHEANCPCSGETMRTAALKGWLDSVQYLVDSGCPFPEWKEGKQIYLRAMNDSNTTVNGIQCLYLAKCPWDGLIVRNARTPAQRQFLLDNGCPKAAPRANKRPASSISS